MEGICTAHPVKEGAPKGPVYVYSLRSMLTLEKPEERAEEIASLLTSDSPKLYLKPFGKVEVITEAHPFQLLIGHYSSAFRDLQSRESQVIAGQDAYHTKAFSSPWNSKDFILIASLKGATIISNVSNLNKL